MTQFLSLKRRWMRPSTLYTAAIAQMYPPVIGWSLRQSRRSRDSTGPEGLTPPTTPSIQFVNKIKVVGVFLLEDPFCNRYGQLIFDNVALLSGPNLSILNGATL